MDMRSWKKVLLQWIAECGFMYHTCYSIEQSDIDVFYQNFCLKHQKTAKKECKRLEDFLKEFYPDFEINLDDENCLSSADYIYVYSLLLHFCCVKQPETLFHEICQRLPDTAQQYIAGFFKTLLDSEPVTKEALRHAIAEVGNLQITPPRLSDSVASNLTASASGSSLSSYSPLKTPKRSAGSQRISPSTPKSYLLEERTRELYNLRAQLETERYEKGLLEVQIKQNEEEIEKLNNNQKKLLQQVQDLKNDILIKVCDASTNNDDDEGETQDHKRILKELSEKEVEVIKLSDNIRTLREENTLLENRLKYAEEQILLCMNRIKELDTKVDELTEELKEKNGQIKYLTERKLELEQFISETRSSSSGANIDPNVSADCLDSSFVRNSNKSNGSNSLGSPENLGASVIDVQLREKEHENQQLREELKNMQREHKRLAKHLTKLTEEFDLPLDTSSTTSTEDSSPDNELEPYEEESSSEDDASHQDQLVIFNSCMEKLNKFHKSEKTKMRQLEQESISLQEENKGLTKKLNQLTQEVKELNEKLKAKEMWQQKLEKAKQQVEEELEKSKHDLMGTEKQKNKLYKEVQSLESANDKLNENMKKLKTKLELQQQQSKELITNNKQLDETKRRLQTQLEELEKELNHKNSKWNEELKGFTEKIEKQMTEIEMYKQTEKTLKSNYESMIVQNEELKNEARQANIHLCVMRNELNEKENQLTLLGKEIAAFTQKNEELEQNVCNLMEEHKREMLANSNIKLEMDEQLKKVKDKLAKMELLMDSKQHECELQQQRIEELKTKVNRILELCNNDGNNDYDDDNDNIGQNLEKIRKHFENLLEKIKDLNFEFVGLKETHKDALVKIEKLEEHKAECLRLTTENKAYKERIELLQHQQACILEKAKHDLQAKELELQDRLREASAEYEASMERIAVELKLEKEHHNNKDLELILTKAEQNEAKKKLNEAEKEIQNLRNEIQQLQQTCDRLKQFESRVVECSEENNNLRLEIETFKSQVAQNALRLLEADKALTEFMELTKEQNTAKSEVEILKNTLKEKENILTEMESKLQTQSLYEIQIKQLQQQLAAQQEEVENLNKDRERLSKETVENNEHLVKEQQEKLILLTTLEKSTDQLKLAAEEKQQKIAQLEEQLQDLKNQISNLTQQNTTLQGDLIERKAELRLSLDEQLQDKEDFELKVASQTKILSEKTEKLEALETSVIEILAIMENNFNFSQEIMQNDVKNVFNYNEDKDDRNIQKLRNHLNNILHLHRKITEEIKELTTQKQAAMASVATLKENNNDLLAKLNKQENLLKETQKQLKEQELIAEKRISQEIQRLEEDLLNVENVNERLANENAKIQSTLDSLEEEYRNTKLKLESLEEETLQLKEEIRTKSLLLEKLQKEDKKSKEKCQQIEKLSEKCKHFEIQLKEKTTRLQTVEKEYQEIREKAHKSQLKLTHFQQTEYKKLLDKLKLIQISNDSLEKEVDNKNKELLALTNTNAELLQKQKDLEEQLKLTTSKLDEMVTNKLNVETKWEKLQSEAQQLRRDLDFTKAQQQAQQDEHSRLNQEIEALKVDKQHLRDEIYENKLTLQRSNENVTQLIQQVSSIRLEKEAALEENQLLRKQLEETGKNQTTSETKMKSIIEKSQDFERKLLATENELKSLKAYLAKSESCSEKLQTENKKLRETQEASTKRIEKLALKLGDSQAKGAKLERENEKLVRTLESHAVTVESLKREKDLLQSEAKSLKERLSRAERGHEQLAIKVQSLEHLNVSLQQIKQKLETSEIDGKTKLNKLEKMREANEEKIRKLTNSLNNAENVNVKLNLEIGALNSELQEIKIERNKEQSTQIEEIKTKLTEAQELNEKFEEINEKLKIELDVLKEENSSLNDQLSKAALSLQITSQKCERFAAELEQIRADMLIMKQEKSQIEEQHELSLQKLRQFESQNVKHVEENKNLIKTLEQKISQLEEELTAKSETVVELQNEIETLKANSESHSSLAQQNAAVNLTELEDLRKKLSLAEDIRLREQQVISQLRLDNQILHSKYQDSKKRALDAATYSEERIKENRLELEGKLEKMKNKMKTLYTEEITKMKTKQEREIAVIKSEMEVLKNQNTKYEEHTRKLANQIVRLNDNILQHQKENTILSTKLKHTMDQLHEERNKQRPNPIHVSTISSSSAPNIGPNLAMEDEEGEIFNNTYLTDMKDGRMSEYMSRNICVEELKYRNSLLPPHLRSTYAAQFDHEFTDDDPKDGPHSLDDSMSALLSTTAGGTRKKFTGVTHYKRPGPPTPSKNGGRLSFGGISEPGREILKESNDTNTGYTASSSKTPARFNFFTSRFSMGNTKDEKSNTKKETDEPTSQKATEKSKIKRSVAARRLLAGVGCTSTPRKSKLHFDQRRLLDQLMSSSTSPSPLTNGNKNKKQETKLTPPEVSMIETPLTALDKRDVPKAPMHKTIVKRLEAIAGGIKRSRRYSSSFGRRLSRRIQEICTPTSGETTSSALTSPAKIEKQMKRNVVLSSSVSTSDGIRNTTLAQRRLRKRHKKERCARSSLYLRGNMFAKYRTPNKRGQNDLNCYKSRRQRFEHFNKARNMLSLRAERQEEEDEFQKTITCTNIKDITYDLNQNNNNYTKFKNKLPREIVVVAKCQPNKQELIEDTFTFGEEQFEQPNTGDCDYIQNNASEEEYYEEEDLSGTAKETLITSQDLEDFDRFIANIKPATENEKHDDDYSSQNSLKQFEKLVLETESNAPFDVQPFNASNSSCFLSKSTNSQNSSCSNRSHISSHSPMYSHNKNDHLNLTTATPHHSPSITSSHLSRTIYGGTVIYNHRLPHINTTYVRKSSIYVKKRKGSSSQYLESSSFNDVVLITNQTITFVDIMRMWSQMDNTTRIIISFAVLASLTTLLGLCVSFCSRR